MASNVKVKDFTKFLRENGYRLISFRGSHAKWTNGVNVISVPMVRDINPMLVRRLIKENNLH